MIVRNRRDYMTINRAISQRARSRLGDTPRNPFIQNGVDIRQTLVQNYAAAASDPGYSVRGTVARQVKEKIDAGDWASAFAIADRAGYLSNLLGETVSPSTYALNMPDAVGVNWLLGFFPNGMSADQFAAYYAAVYPYVQRMQGTVAGRSRWYGHDGATILWAAYPPGPAAQQNYSDIVNRTPGSPYRTGRTAQANLPAGTGVPDPAQYMNNRQKEDIGLKDTLTLAAAFAAIVGGAAALTQGGASAGTSAAGAGASAGGGGAAVTGGGASVGAAAAGTTATVLPGSAGILAEIVVVPTATAGIGAGTAALVGAGAVGAGAAIAAGGGSSASLPSVSPQNIPEPLPDIVVTGGASAPVPLAPIVTAGAGGLIATLPSAAPGQTITTNEPSAPEDIQEITVTATPQTPVNPIIPAAVAIGAGAAIATLPSAAPGETITTSQPPGELEEVTVTAKPDPKPEWTGGPFFSPGGGLMPSIPTLPEITVQPPDLSNTPTPDIPSPDSSLLDKAKDILDNVPSLPSRGGGGGVVFVPVDTGGGSTVAPKPRASSSSLFPFALALLALLLLADDSKRKRATT